MTRPITMKSRHYMGESEILEALSREEHTGRFRWWFERPLLSRTWLAERLDEVVEQVGPRYNRNLTIGVQAGRKIANFARLSQLLADLEQHAASAVATSSYSIRQSVYGDDRRFA
ncbi:hypothetical protein ABT235_12095 [Micromonospora echinofusca]|uniref:hypothetical protein n=1 Tax=Micromonospora echinofusca TaxID=47858 RepID=UPI003331C96E